jgi:AraC-like DNA-binding protein
MNFYDFVNRYRLEEFKKLASDPKNRQFTMLALAFDCGFNSKSSFNRYFKKATGQTPSQYFTALSKQ